MDFEKKINEGLQLFEVFKAMKENLDILKNVEKVRKEQEALVVALKNELASVQVMLNDTDKKVQLGEQELKAQKVKAQEILEVAKSKAAGLEEAAKETAQNIIARAQEQGVAILQSVDIERSARDKDLVDLQDKINLATKAIDDLVKVREGMLSDIVELDKKLKSQKAALTKALKEFGE